MKTLYTQEQFDSTKSNDKLPLQCYHCGNNFLKRKAYILAFLNGDTSCPNKFCSKKCANDSKNKKIIVKCLQCNKEHLKLPKDISKTCNIFCSQKCSALYNNKNRIYSDETKEKLRQAYYKNEDKIKLNFKRGLKPKKPPVEKICPTCNTKFTKEYGQRKIIYCSPECAYNSKTVRELMSNNMKEKVANGTHSGWMSRTKVKPSYPEQFFIDVFAKNNITNYEREKKVGRFFIDFAFQDCMLALEIDGKQHEYQEYKLRDARKTLFLESLGWEVHRIKWKNIRKEDGKKYIKEEIDKLFKLINFISTEIISQPTMITEQEFLSSTENFPEKEILKSDETT